MSGDGGRTAEGGLNARLKRFQVRYEPMVTRILLLVLFVTEVTAQFVTPLGDFLQDKAFLGGALLSLVGYVLYDSVKDLDSSLRRPTPLQVKSQELGTFVTEAFRARTVDIRFLGYTGETLYHELYHRLERLLEDPGPTRHVCIRVLIPDFGQPMTVPSRVGPDGRPQDDPAYRRGLEAQCQMYDQRLSAIAERLTSGGRVTAECEYRLYPGIPRDKICVFNRELALHGLYDVVTRTVQRSSEPEFYDPKGYRTDLNVWSREGDEDSKSVVATWNKHLDDLWSLSAAPSWRALTPTAPPAPPSPPTPAPR
ncbi:hypothetical protein [Streptomyces olivochromogenes]|uniref:hypothetical protein n=1 Tax=Streptomyces olivochromogenes TaxID=1963 RepID=UPI0036C99B5A